MSCVLLVGCWLLVRVHWLSFDLCAACVVRCLWFSLMLCYALFVVGCLPFVGCYLFGVCLWLFFMLCFLLCFVWLFPCVVSFLLVVAR